MSRIFLPVAVALTLVGGASAQSLSDRLGGAKPKVEVKPEVKAEHRFQSPFKVTEPAKKPVGDLYEPFVPPAPAGLWEPRLGPGSAVLKGLDSNPFGKPAKPAPLWEPDLRDFGKWLPPAEFVRPMDTAAMPTERAMVIGWKKGFPNLGDDFEVQGAGTPNAQTCATKAGTDKAIPGTYNCIAHTAGIKNVWVNPYQKGEGWDLYYNPLGYKKVAGTDTSFEKGAQKVAVYATKLPDGRLKQYTHAAIQEADGTWTSKLGSGPLIRHRTAESVAGGTYGDVVRVYARTR